MKNPRHSLMRYIKKGCGITVYFCNVRMLLRSPDLEPFHNAKISVV
jgi:hypothetical protein